MKKSRCSEDQIIGFLKRVDARTPIKELCRQGGFRDASGDMDKGGMVGLVGLEPTTKGL